MEKILLETLEVAKKAGDAAAADDCRQPSEVDRCLNALKWLKKMQVTKEFLIEYKVGKLLLPLKKHNDEKIKVAASDLFNSWQSILNNQASKSKNNITNTSVVAIQSEHIDDKKSTSRDEKGKFPIHHEATPNDGYLQNIFENLSNSTTGINAPPHHQNLEEVEKCNDKFRNNLREDIAEALRRVWKETLQSTREEVRALREKVEACNPHHMAVVVERALYTDFENYSFKFRAKLRSIIFNLRDGSNPDFRRRVLIGQIHPAQIAGLSTEDMASDERKRRT